MAKSQPPSPYYMQVLASLARAYDFDLQTPWKDLPEQAQRVVLHGTAGKPVTLRFVDGRRSYDVNKPFEGVLGNLNRRMLATESAWMREELSRYQSSLPCDVCDRARLKPEALSVKIAGEDISIATRRSVADAYAWFGSLEPRLTPQQREIAHAILKEINERLGFLHNVGLDYLHLDRTSGTLSGGDSQRIRLASQIGSGLSGVLYVLDEPSIGLHQKDNDRLLETLQRLKSLGNTVLVVEHDEDSIRSADHVIDMGPGAGIHGGEVVCAGTLDDLLACEGSLTADYLSGRRHPRPRHPPQGHRQHVTVRGATANNLRDVTVKFLSTLAPEVGPRPCYGVDPAAAPGGDRDRGRVRVQVLAVDDAARPRRRRELVIETPTANEVTGPNVTVKVRVHWRRGGAADHGQAHADRRPHPRDARGQDDRYGLWHHPGVEGPGAGPAHAAGRVRGR